MMICVLRSASVGGISVCHRDLAGRCPMSVLLGNFFVQRRIGCCVFPNQHIVSWVLSLDPHLHVDESVNHGDYG